MTTEPMVFDTPEAIAYYRATVIASGAALYLNTGMNRARVAIGQSASAV